jgi:hypothetical protein
MLDHYARVSVLAATDVTSGGYVGFWVILYFAMLVFLGITCLRKGHLLWFILGIFLPFCWIIGAFLPRRL